jgi:hypothetical protein
MKTHFISLLDPEHKKKTIFLLIIATLFIIIPLLVGIDQDLPGIMFFLGIILLFFAVSHPWKKAANYGILIGLCIGILLLVFLGITILEKMGKGETINDNLAEGMVFFICVPGIIVGITGAIICAVKKK